MSERYGLASKSNGISRAGITIHIEPSDDNSKPLDVTLYVKKPGSGDNILDPDDDNSFTATGKLLFKFGKRGIVELFAENTSLVKDNDSEQEGL